MESLDVQGAIRNDFCIQKNVSEFKIYKIFYFLRPFTAGKKYILILPGFVRMPIRKETKSKPHIMLGG